MSTGTVSSLCSLVTSSDVLGMGDQFEVVWVDAVPYMAQMVDL